MTKNYQLLKGAQMGGRFKSPGKSPKRLAAGRRRSGGGGAGGVGPLAAVGGGGAGVAANIRVAVRVRSDKTSSRIPDACLFRSRLPVEIRNKSARNKWIYSLKFLDQCCGPRSAFIWIIIGKPDPAGSWSASKSKVGSGSASKWKMRAVEAEPWNTDQYRPKFKIVPHKEKNAEISYLNFSQ